MNHGTTPLQKKTTSDFTCVIQVTKELQSTHPIGSTLTSDWSINSFKIVVLENFLKFCSNDLSKVRLNFFIGNNCKTIQTNFESPFKPSRKTSHFRGNHYNSIYSQRSVLYLQGL